MKIGIICEEDNDLDVINELTSKLIPPHRFSYKKFIGHGCGKLRRKCTAWANNLIKSGCDHLVVIHDLDTNDENDLRNKLTDSIKHIGFAGYVVLIPTREIEAWLLSDAQALQKTFKMQGLPKVPARPERERRAKEKLRDIIWKFSKKRYVNTIHNGKIASFIRINQLNTTCASFKPFPQFIKKYLLA